MSHEEQHYFASLSPQKYLSKNNDQLSEPDNNDNLREIGDEALSWELTSAKSGHGVQQLRDDNLTTFWQSDGMVPHKVSILFHKKQLIENVAIYTDYKLDESYTPQNIIINASTSSLHNYETDIVCNKELNEPSGWITLKCKPHKRQNPHDQYLKTNKIIFEIQSSHQSGRDTHIRQIKIYAPNNKQSLFMDNNCLFDTDNNKNDCKYDQEQDEDEDEDEEKEYDEEDDDNDYFGMIQPQRRGNKKRNKNKNKGLVFKSKAFTSLELLQHASLR